MWTIRNQMPYYLHNYTKLIFIILLFNLNCAYIFGQVNNDTINLKEITVERDKKTQMTGFLSGNIKLHVDGVKGLPAITGNTDLMKILELTPAARTSGDGNSNLYIRGGDPGQNLLLYNEGTVYSPGHILNIFPLFNADHLSSIELLKTGVNARYGGFISSAIMVRSKTELPQKTSIKGSVGLLSSQATADIYFNKKWGGYLSGRKTYIEYLLKPLINATVNNKRGGDIDDIKYDFYDTNLTLIGKLSTCNTLYVDALLGADKLDIKDDDIILNGFIKWRNIVLSGTLETNLGNNIRMVQNISYSNYRNKLQTSQSEMYLHILSEVKEITYKNRFNYSIGTIPLESGVQYSYRDILPQDTKLQNTGIYYKGQPSVNSTAHDASFYTTALLQLTPHLYIEPGLRYNMYYSKVKEENITKPFHNLDIRLSGRYQLKADKYLRASYSHNTQYVNKLTPSSVGLPTDFWIMASDKIKPQKGQEISTGYYQVFQDGLFELSTDIYYRKVKNVTEFDQNFIENDNTLFTDKILYGTGQAYGLEFMLKKNTGRLTGWISYALGRSDRKVAGVNNGQTYPAKFDRRHDFSFAGSYKINNRWDASLVYIYATGGTYTQPNSWYFINNMPVKYYDKYNGARMPAYNRTDLSVNYWFKKDNGINFSIYNMFMIKNPIYIFMIVKQDSKTDKVKLDVKQKRLFRLIPSVSWNFKF